MRVPESLFLPRFRPGLVFVGAVLLTALVYWPGLGGGFYFDDFANIVLNPFIQLKELRLSEFWAAMHSSLSGPTGRPLAMASFALDHWLFGLHPKPMKLVNLGVHLINAALLWGLLRKLLPNFPGLTQNGRWLAGGVAFLWLIHPLHVSSVLYVVQRMTLLSASFMLIGLLGYCYFRCRSQPRMGLALGILLLATAVSVFAKENGVLALGYAALIEFLVLRFRGLDTGALWLARGVFGWLPLLGAMALVGYWCYDPDWFARAYTGRDFNVIERLLTEARVLAFYQYLIALPDLSAMGLYHDDWTVSKSLWDPPTTGLALLWHGLALGLAWWLQRTVPLITFGLFWFYASHVLESTFWPLELVFEHRNYLATAGGFMALFGLIQWLYGKWATSPMRVHPTAWIVGLLASILATATWVRASDWGDLFGHGFMEAKRHPTSARSQFEAGQMLAQGIMHHPNLAGAYYSQAREHYWAATRLDRRGLAPLVSLMALDIAVQRRIDEKVFQELQYRLSHAKPDASFQINFHALAHQILTDSHNLYDRAKALALFDAALANPQLSPRERAEALVGKALYLNAHAQDTEALAVLEQAVALMPHRLDSLILLAAKQIDLGHFEQAQSTLERVQNLDRFKIARQDIDHLRQKLHR